MALDDDDDDDGTDDNSTNSPPLACQVCGAEGGRNNDRNCGHLDENNGDGQRGRRRRLLRCTQCQNAWYCSVDCQRLDWERGGHRQLCHRLRRSKKSNAAAASASAAAVELVRLVSSLSVDQATESYHKSMDEIITKKQQQQQQHQRMDVLIKNKKRHEAAASSKNHNRVVSSRSTTTTTATAQKEPKTLGVDVTTVSGSTAMAVAASSSLSSSSPPRHHPLLPPPCWDFYVEDLTRLSCYQIVILLNDVDLSSNNETATTNNNKTNNVFLHDNLDIAITLARPYHRRGEDYDADDDDDDDASYVVRIAMQQQQEQQERETTAISKDNNNSPTIANGKMILQLALPAGIVILPNNTYYNNNMQDDDNNQMTIPYTMDTTMNGRQGLVSIRLRYTTTKKHAILLQQQQQNQQFLQSPISQLLQEPPSLEVPSWSLHENEQLLTPNEANRLACRACGHFLFIASLQDDEKSIMMMMKIQRVLPMPSGRWEDMADYLTCYEGQAVVDFSSSNISVAGSAGKNLNSSINKSMTLLQDETTLVLSHVVVDMGDEDFEKNNDRDDNNDDSHSPVLSFPSVCRLSVPGYGQVQQASTSSSSWRNSLGVGGNNNNKVCLALACNLCCSVVGEAQEEEEEMDEKPEQDEFSQQSYFTYRFWKHRLVVIPKEEDEKEKKLPLLTKTTTATSRKILSSTLAFMVQELIRLAETKAIYTLSIFCDKGMVEKSSNNDDAHKKPQSPQVMVLRLVSWGDSSTCAAMVVMEAGTSANFKDTTHDTANKNDLEAIVYPLKTWRPMAKVLYEIRNVSDKPDELFPYPQQGPVASNKNTDNDVWSMLNQNDWCCPLPPSGQKRWQRQQRSATGEEEKKESMSNDNKDNSNEQQNSGPRPALPPQPAQQQRQCQVILESWEWHQVLDDLQESSRVYGKQVVSATFFAKTGQELLINFNNDNNGDNNDNNDNVVTQKIGLAAVLL